MRRNVERMYNLPPDKQRERDELFARMDALNAARRLEQDALDEEFVEFTITHRLSTHIRKETDNDYILYNSL